MSEDGVPPGGAIPWQSGNRCPMCQGTKVAIISYGYPSQELLDEQPEDIVLGGCIIEKDSPRWVCKDCGHRFGSAS